MQIDNTRSFRPRLSDISRFIVSVDTQLYRHLSRRLAPALLVTLL